MKPLSEIDDEAAMILRGRRSTLASARNEAEAALRDAYTQMSGCEWKDLPVRVAAVQAWVNRLDDIYGWWEHVNAPTTTKAAE